MSRLISGSTAVHAPGAHHPPDAYTSPTARTGLLCRKGPGQVSGQAAHVDQGGVRRAWP